MEPRIIRKKQAGPLMRVCNNCNLSRSSDDFLDIRYWVYKDGKFVVCNTCLKEHFATVQWDWQEVDKFCQTINIPFVPAEFERLHDINGDDVLPIYVKMFQRLEYENLEWQPYHDKYLELKRKGKLDLELPNVRDSYYDDLRLRWGPGYDEYALDYLENLYNGMLMTQNINGALQTDQAQKLCKVSWEIDERIRGSNDFDKLMASYEKMAKIADFTPKNIKSDSDFSSTGEIIAWLERRGWLNPHYDNVKRDPIDELAHSTTTFAQRLYVNENGAGEDVNERIMNLRLAAELEKSGSELERRRLEDDPDFKLAESSHLEERELDMYQELIIDDVLDNETTRV